jgi:hypothetical protein
MAITAHHTVKDARPQRFDGAYLRFTGGVELEPFVDRDKVEDERPRDLGVNVFRSHHSAR